MTNRNWVSLGCAVAAALLMAVPALAQDEGSGANEAEAGPLEVPEPLEGETESPVALESAVEELTVTARRREEYIQDVPLAVTMLTASQLESSFTRDLAEITGFSPNVIIDPVRAGPSATAISIRGISFQDIEKSFDPAVGVFIDDVYIGTTTSQLLSDFDVATIEVLRGPQGTLFGKNTIGGAVRLTRTRPTGELGVKASVTFGDYQRNDYRFLLNFPIIEDKLAGKVWAYSAHDNGYMYNSTKNERVAGLSYTTTGAQLLWTPRDDVQALFTFEHILDDTPTGALINMSQPAGQNTYLPGGDLQCTAYGRCAVSNLDRVTTQNFSDDARMNLNATTLQVDWEIADVGTLTSITGWRGHNEIVNQDFDATGANFFSTVRSQTYDQASQEFRLASEQFGNFQFVAGLYFWWARYNLDQSTSYISSILVPGTPESTNLVQQTSQDTYSFAPFFQADYAITDWLTATAGLRYTWEEKDLTRYQIDVELAPGVLIPNTSSPPLAKNWYAFTPSAGLDARITDQALTYFLYSRGFKSGGWNGRATSASALGPYDPETVESFELGLKSDWLDGMVRANVALFWNIYDDKQEEIVVPAPDSPLGQQTLVENASAARTRGVELELTIYPFEGLSIHQSFGYLNAEFTEGEFFIPASATSESFTQPFSELDLRRAPPFQYGVFVDYTRQIGSGTGLFHIDWRWVDDYETTFLNFDFGETPAHGLLNAAVSYTWPAGPDGMEWKAMAFGRNITNETYISSALEVGGLFAFGAINPPSTWGLEIGFSY